MIFNVKKIILNCFILAFMFLFIYVPAKAEDLNLTISVSFLDVTVSGIYSGETTASIPNGHGTFHSSSDPTISIDGTWENGVLNGPNTITFLADNSTISACFESGIIEGTVTETAPDGSYDTFRCKNGEPVSKVSCYSSSGQLISTDWFYYHTKISKLEENAESPDYSLLFTDSSSYIDSAIKIEGTVKNIYDDAEKTYLKVEDTQGHLYICQYKNRIGSPNKQAHVPNLQENNRVILYGFFEDCKLIDSIYFLKSTYSVETDSLNTSTSGDLTKIPFLNSNFALLPSVEYPQIMDHDFENTLPLITLFSGYISNDSFDSTNLTFTYEELSKYPYEYFGSSFSFQGTVLRENINSEEKSVRMMIQENNTKHLYYCTCKLNDNIPILGDTITLKGVLKGNHKISVYNSSDKSASYFIYPRLFITSFEHIK